MLYIISYIKKKKQEIFEKLYQIRTIFISSSEDIDSLRSLLSKSSSVFLISVFRRRNILDLCISRFVFLSSIIMFDSSSSNTYLSISMIQIVQNSVSKFYFILLILFHHAFLQTTDDRFHFSFS